MARDRQFGSRVILQPYEKIQFLPGRVPVQTTERHLGRKQKLGIAVNDRIGIESTRGALK